MAEFSGRPQYDDPQKNEEDEAVAESGTELVYRRLAASSGEAIAMSRFPNQREGHKKEPRSTSSQQGQVELKGLRALLIQSAAIATSGWHKLF